MRKTKKYKLNKPEQDDFFDVDHQNDNMDKLEEILSGFEQKHTQTDEEILSMRENEQLIAETIGEETRRAKEAEQANANAIQQFKETNGASTTELQEALANEVKRADEAEKSIAKNLSEEITRAEGAEQKNAEDIADIDTRVQALEKGGTAQSGGKKYKFSSSDSIKMTQELDEDAEDLTVKITAAIKDAAITKAMLSEEVLALFSDDTLKKKYKQALDDIYDALVSRGLVFPKENIEDYANQIRNLKMIDLDLTFTDNINKCIDVSISTGEIDAIVGMTDNLVTNVSVPAASRLTENLTELMNISIPATVVTVVDNLTENVTTE